MQMHLTSIRIGKKQLEKIDNLASQLNISRAQVIRYLIEGHFDRMRPLILSNKERSSLSKLWRESVEKLGNICTKCNSLIYLNQCIGNNVNQIAKASNTHRYISPTTKAAAGKIISTLCCQNDALNNSLTKLWKRLEMTKIGLH